MGNKETKFTNGEWVIDHGAKVYSEIDGEVICKCDDHFVVDKGEVESLANAHLIKTAPKLYEVLHGLISNEDSNLTVNEIMMISELLAEARGE